MALTDAVEVHWCAAMLKTWLVTRQIFPQCLRWNHNLPVLATRFKLVDAEIIRAHRNAA